jgi:hypothetical protein
MVGNLPADFTAVLFGIFNDLTNAAFPEAIRVSDHPSGFRELGL